jgi:hypothetical protein
MSSYIIEEEELVIQNAIVFTRYLYIKQEVKLALLLSLLNKNEEHAIFWTQELYYSGFIQELLEYIFKIYYDFYASLNGSFETYLLKKTNEILKHNHDSDPNSSPFELIIKNLLIRPFNLDTFILINICNLFEVECNYDILNIQNTLKSWISEDDHFSIAQFILKENKALNECQIYEIVLSSFESEINKSKLLKEFSRNKIAHLNTKHILIAKIMELFANRKKLKLGNKKYVSAIPYSLQNHTQTKNWQILRQVCKFSIDEYKNLGLFDLYRNKLTKEELINIYNSKWDYYAYDCPYWNEKINSCSGIIDHTNKQIVFNDDDLFEEFHNNYDFEPDEQPMEVKNKSVGVIDKIMDLEKFYAKYKTQTVLDIDTDIITYMKDETLFYVK